MNFPEKIETALLGLRLARANLKDYDLETHKRDLDKIIKDLKEALSEYWEGYYG